MKNLKSHLVLICCTFCISIQGIAQPLTGTKTIGGSSPDFSTLAAAVASLNTNGTAFGGVVFNIAAGHTEVAANITLTTTTGADTSPIVFRKSGSGLNPLITAAAGTSTSTDGIIKIAGTDYVEFDGIDVFDPTSNTSTTTRM